MNETTIAALLKLNAANRAELGDPPPPPEQIWINRRPTREQAAERAAAAQLRAEEDASRRLTAHVNRIRREQNRKESVGAFFGAIALLLIGMAVLALLDSPGIECGPLDECQRENTYGRF